MTNQKEIWTPEQVEKYLQSLKSGSKRRLPNNVYVTENFTWNEVLRTDARNIDMPSRQVLENLKTSANVLQNYRNKVGKPITITSSWRTPTEQKALINAYKGKKAQNKSAGRPSETSLHMEGLALDFIVDGVKPLSVYEHFDKTLMGELEKSPIYTHVGLPTYSEKYLKNNGIFSEKLYKKLDVNEITLTPYEQSKVIKRLDASSWKTIPSNFDAKANVQEFKNFKTKTQIPKTNTTTSTFTQTRPAQITADKRTPAQKFDDEIRTKYRLMQEERKRRYPVFRKSNASQSNSSGNGRWVTINGHHVYID